MQTKAQGYRVLIICCLGLFMAMLDTLIVGVALPQIAEKLQADMLQLEWIMNAYTLIFAVCMIPFSVWAERIGRRNGFVIGLVLFTAGFCLAGLSTSIELLIAARAIQGLGAAAILPISLTLIYTSFPEEKRSLAVGLWSGISGLGLAIGPFAGGLLMLFYEWPVIFLVNLPIGLIAIISSYIWIRESYGDSQRFDWLGLLLLLLGLFGLTYGIMSGNIAGWTDAVILTSLSIGIVFILVFLWWQLRTSHPLITLRLFRYRSFTIINFSAFWMSAGIFGAIFLLTLFLQQIQGYTPFEAGMREMVWTVMTMIAAPVAGIAVGRISVRSLLILGMLLQAAGLVSFAVAITLFGGVFDFIYLVPGMIAAGIGMGICFTSIQHGVLYDLPDNRTGEGSGISNTLRELGGVFGIAIAGAVFHHGGVVETQEQYVAALVPSVYICAAMLLLSAVAVLPLRFAKSERLTADA